VENWDEETADPQPLYIRGTSGQFEFNTEGLKPARLELPSRHFALKPGLLTGTRDDFVCQQSQCSTVDTTPEVSPPFSPRTMLLSMDFSSVVSASGYSEEIVGSAYEEAVAALPTVGSARHLVGKCKPCAFAFKEGCESGASCEFCHLCPPGEKKRRKKHRKEVARHTRVMKAMQFAASMDLDAPYVALNEYQDWYPAHLQYPSGASRYQQQ
jgi:hypothetical protein